MSSARPGSAAPATRAMRQRCWTSSPIGVGTNICPCKSAEKARKGPRKRPGRSEVPHHPSQKPEMCRPFCDGETRTRTGDTTIFSRVLYQLSYLAEPRTG